MAGGKVPFRFRRSVFEDACRKIYGDGGMNDSMMQSPEVTALIEETCRIISSAVDRGLTEEAPAELRYALENNAFIFSGFKAYHSLREAGLSMIGSDGRVKPFSAFLQDVRAINARYNGNWLRAEYNHALASSQMAAKWSSLEKNPDRYMLQYRTARDTRVREEHAALDGITLPADDPFWDRYYPPNGWNCRCNAVQVRRARYTSSDPEKAMKIGNEATEGPKKAIFRFNAGRTMQVFPPKHPYYKAPENARKVIMGIAEQKRIKDMIKELPGNLTQEEKQKIAEHNLILEKTLGTTKGPVMNYSKANNGNENPNYKNGGGYTVNCQTCTVTHMLRRLGFNVEARPNVKGSAFDEMKKQGISWQQRFTNLDGSDVDYDFTFKWKRRKGYGTMTTQRLAEYFQEKLSQDGIYEVYCGWKNGNAHVFCAEVENGNIHYFDPQNGNSNAVGYIAMMKPGMVGILRIDNKLINPKLKKLFITK